jgi:hypothetical protein
MAIPEYLDFDLIADAVRAHCFFVSYLIDRLCEETVGTRPETFQFISQEFASNCLVHRDSMYEILTFA